MPSTESSKKVRMSSGMQWKIRYTRTRLPRDTQRPIWLVGEKMSTTARGCIPSDAYSVGTRSSDSKPHVLCDPSQNGRVAEWPQRHKAMAGLSLLKGKRLPPESSNSTVPSTSKDRSDVHEFGLPP